MNKKMSDEPGKPFKVEKLEDLYLMESHRKASFKAWVHGENSSCSIARMAEAGFYWCGDKLKDDMVKCFVCRKTLTGWKPKDDPWVKHQKQSPECLFVKYHLREGDLTVQQFLEIYTAVVKGHLMHEFNAIKEEFLRETSLDLDKKRRGKF